MFYEILIQDRSGSRRVHSTRDASMPSAGDTVELEINGEDYEMTVLGINDVYRESGKIWRVILDEQSAVKSPT